MNASTERRTLDGPAGPIEALIDKPAEAEAESPRGLAVIAHPHPLYAGTMENKVVQTMARACVAAGYTAVRFNFRGVGQSGGVYDEGRGETHDYLAVVAQLAPDATTPLVLAGFSFGTFVVSQALSELDPARQVDKIALIGAAVSRFAVPPLSAHLHARTLVLHGELDDTVPLADVLNWARPQSLPVTVIPGGGHFFHGQLPLLKELVLRHLCSNPL